jgi:hypothetical protein
VTGLFTFHDTFNPRNNFVRTGVHGLVKVQNTVGKVNVNGAEKLKFFKRKRESLKMLNLNKKRWRECRTQNAEQNI